MKKIVFIGIFLCLFSTFFLVKNNFEQKSCFVFQGANLNIEDELAKTITEQINYFDFSELDTSLNEIENKSSFGAETFFEKISKLISGEYSFEFKNFFAELLQTFVIDFKKLVPLLSSILGLALLSNIVGQFKLKNNKNLGIIVHFVCYCVIIILVCGSVTSLINLSIKTINGMRSQMEVVFPIILTLMASVGNVVSVGIYKPIMAILSGLIINIFSYIVIPIFLMSFVVSVVGNLSNNVKLNKLSSFLNSSFKWIIGVVFTIFTGTMMAKGISAGSFDSVSIRTTKFALKTYVPLVGGYLSDGFNLIMASSILIKNAVGTAGLLLIFLSILSPLITILVFKWSLHLLSGLIEPMIDNKISSFLFQTSKAINMLVASILCVCLMYIISIALLLTSGNAYWG